MTTNRYARLLEADLAPEAFARAALGALEAGFREMALLALHDWAQRDIASSEMFTAVASLQRPSWGMWNGLLSALRNARKATLRAGDAAERQRLEQARALERVLARLDENVAPALVAALKPLGELTRTQVGTKLKLGAALAMPIGLRNRVAHDTPTDPAWWDGAAAALRPLVAFLAEADPVRLAEEPGGFPSPWFLVDGKRALAFNGVERDFSVLYVNEAGVSRHVPERTQEVLLAFGRLLGRSDEQERDFKKLLSKHAPEEIRGVMMGDWLVGPPVGEGGFARVHVGRQLSTGRKAAIKIMHDGMEPETVLRFQQEAAFLSRFRHPNIVGVYGYGQEAWSAPRAFSLTGEPWFDAFAKTAPVKTFIALEWIEGRTLDDVFRDGARIPEGRPDQRTLANWMADAANALSAVHAAGLIHRDIKPHNLMVTTEAANATGRTVEGWGEGSRIKLMDFGIARVQKAERTLVTESGRAMGTPAYMSPEQIRAADAEGEVGPASDVYSLAATFYELFTGQRLYHHDTATLEEVKTAKIAGRRPVRPRLVVKGLPWEVETILLGGLEPEPADRYRAMDALERDVRHFLADEPIAYKRPSWLRRTQLVYRRNRVVSNLVACFVVLAAAGVIAYVHSIGVEQRRTAAQRDIAVRNEGIATEQRRLAQDRERDVRLNLANLLANNGHALLDKADPAGAQLWYVRALPLAADAPAQDRLNRLRVGVTLRQLPRPVRMWNYALGERQTVYVASMDYEGRRVATGEAGARRGADGAVETFGGTRVLDALTGRVIAGPIAHEKVVFAVGLSRDGSRLLTLSEDRAARVYDVATGKLLLPPLVHAGGIGRGEFGPDGRRLMTLGDDDRKLRVWDLDKGEVLFPPIELAAPASAVAMSLDGARLLVGVPIEPAATEKKGGAAGVAEKHGDAIVRTFDAATGRPLSSPVMVPSLWHANLSPDGTRFAAASANGWARVYNAATGEPVSPQFAHAGPVTRTAFSRDGKRLATASGDRTARVWNVETGAFVSLPMPHEAAPFALGFSRDGKRLLTIAYDKGVRLWDAESGWPVGSQVRSPAEVQDAAFVEGNEDQVVVVTQAGATTWDFSRCADPGVMRFETAFDTSRTAFSPDSLRLALNSKAGKVRVLSTATGEVLIDGLPHPRPVTEVCFSPDGSRVVTASLDGAARVWDVSATGALLRGTTRATTAQVTSGPSTAAANPEDARVVALLRHDGPVNAAVFSPSGKWVATASADGTARVWDAATGQPVGPSLRHDKAVSDVAFNADGTRVVTASEDDTARVWDAAGGAPVTPPLKHRGMVGHARFSPDGTLVLCPDTAGYVSLWEVPSGTLVSRVYYGSGAQEAVFSPDGANLLAAGFGDFVKVFATKSPQSPTAVLPTGDFSNFARFAPDGATIFASSFTGRRLWNAAGGPIGPVLHRQPLGYGDFSPDGRWLVTVDSKVRTWDVTPDPRPSEDLAKLAALLAGRSLDERGVIGPLDAAAAMKLFDEVRLHDPRELEPRDGAHAAAPASAPSTRPATIP